MTTSKNNIISYDVMPQTQGTHSTFPKYLSGLAEGFASQTRGFLASGLFCSEYRMLEQPSADDLCALTARLEAVYDHFYTLEDTLTQSLVKGKITSLQYQEWSAPIDLAVKACRDLASCMTNMPQPPSNCSVSTKDMDLNRSILDFMSRGAPPGSFGTSQSKVRTLVDSIQQSLPSTIGGSGEEDRPSGFTRW